MGKRYEYYVVLSGEGNASGSFTTRSLHPFFNHELSYADIVKMREYISKEYPYYHWEVSFIRDLSIMTSRFFYVVEFIKWGHNTGPIKSYKSLSLDHEITESSEKVDLEMFQEFLHTDSNFEYKFDIKSYKLVVQ